MHTLRASSLLTAGAIFATGCSGLSPGENAGVAGALGGAAVGGIARASGMSTGQAIATGAAAGALIGAVTYIIAKHEATERQRRIAEERARVAYARMSAERKAKLKAKKVRYIAVDTEKDQRTAPAAKTTVMVWDTETENVASNNVYDVQTPPAVGTTTKFETYSAEYVGSGT
jgi:HAMP domain-containing protein